MAVQTTKSLALGLYLNLVEAAGQPRRLDYSLQEKGAGVVFSIHAAALIAQAKGAGDEKRANLPMVVGRVRAPKSKLDRITDPDYPRPFAIVLEHTPHIPPTTLLATLCAQFNKTNQEASYILSRVDKAGECVVETYPNKEVAESKMENVNALLRELHIRPLEMDLRKL